MLVMKNRQGVSMILATAAMCLALNIYHEARGENIAGQYAVAMVTMNRAKHDKSKVCGVVLKPHQFSWTTKMVHNKRLLKAGQPKVKQAWWQTQQNTKKKKTNKTNDNTHDTTKNHTKQ